MAGGGGGWGKGSVQVGPGRSTRVFAAFNKSRRSTARPCRACWSREARVVICAVYQPRNNGNSLRLLLVVRVCTYIPGSG